MTNAAAAALWDGDTPTWLAGVTVPLPGGTRGNWETGEITGLPRSLRLRGVWEQTEETNLQVGTTHGGRGAPRPPEEGVSWQP